MGLKDLCRECQLEMKSYGEPLLQACEQTLSSGRLKNQECVRLMYSVGKILSVVQYDKILPYLNLLVSPVFEELQVVTQCGSVRFDILLFFDETIKSTSFS